MNETYNLALLEPVFPHFVSSLYVKIGGTIPGNEDFEVKRIYIVFFCIISYFITKLARIAV